MSSSDGKRPLQKVVVGVLFIAGVVVALRGLIQSDDFTSVVGCILMVIGAVNFFREVKRDGLLAKNYAWYKKTYPQAVNPAGQAACFVCNSSRLHTKNMMNQTYLREHHCGNCGQSLYYSPEKN